MAPCERAIWWFSMLSIEISALSYVSDAQINKVWVTYGQNLARKRLTDVSHFN